MEDEKWQDNFAPEGTERSREGYSHSTVRTTIGV